MVLGLIKGLFADDYASVCGVDGVTKGCLCFTWQIASYNSPCEL